MKRFFSIFPLVILSGLILALFTGCNIYKDYQRPESIKAPHSFRLYQTQKDGSLPDSIVSSIDRELEHCTQLSGDTNHLGFLSWKEIFTDLYLQQLITKALEHNFDLRDAFWKVKECEARVGASRAAFTPSLSLNPNVGMSSQNATSLNYSVPLSASWEIDLFGKLLNAKRAALANLVQMESYQQEVQTQLISSVANLYYTLVMLDRQLAISETTSIYWDKTVQTMESLKLSGRTNEAAIHQSRSGAYSVKVDILLLKQQIREQENALCLLLGEESHPVERSPFAKIFDQTPSRINAGIPIQLLSHRPDVKQAEAALRSAFAATNMARSAFYPQLTLSANGAWTNLVGAIVNPAQLIWSAAAALTMPLFNRGQLRANLRVAKAQQEEATLQFQKTLLQACNEVSDAFNRYQSTTEITKYRSTQVHCMEKAEEYTQSLLLFGTASYLEVITAQQDLLKVQLQEVDNLYRRSTHLISLYRSLGGGAQDTALQELSAQYDAQHKAEAKRRKKK